MNNDRGQRAHARCIIVILIIGAAAFLPGLWPFLLLALPGILIAAVPAVSKAAAGKRRHKQAERSVDTQDQTRQNTEETQRAQEQAAYKDMLIQITELVRKDYPDARWVWETPDAKKQIRSGGRLHILMDRAGGYQRAEVCYSGHQVTGIEYRTGRKGTSPDGMPKDWDAPEAWDVPEEDLPDNYGLLAFQWAQAHIQELDWLCQEAYEKGEHEVLLPAGTLPCPESWQDICGELTRAGTGKAVAGTDGITVIL